MNENESKWNEITILDDEHAYCHEATSHLLDELCLGVFGIVEICMILTQF